MNNLTLFGPISETNRKNEIRKGSLGFMNPRELTHVEDSYRYGLTSRFVEKKTMTTKNLDARN